jgi:hypothetical protein
MQKVVFFLILSLPFIACPTSKVEDPFEELLSQVLREEYGDIIEQNCIFSFEVYHRLYRKPEFNHLRDKNICESNFNIKGTEYFTDDSIRVEFQITYMPNRPVVRGFLKAWNELKQRYESLDSLKIPDPRLGYAWTYQDPYDQDLFVRIPDEPGGVFSTQRWKQLEEIKNWFQDLSENRIVSSDSYSVVMVKNESWEVVTEEGTDG